MKKETSKEVYITFLNNSIALNILLKDNSKIQLLLQRLFFEAKVQAQCFYKIMLETINETWFKVLKIGYLDGIQPKIEVSTQEKRLLVMDEDSLDLIEVCLRTEVDFWRLSKGKVDEDLNESMERLALFLKYTVRIDESNHWFEQVKEGKSKYIDKMKGDMLSSMNTGHQFDNNPLENLRNPPGLSLQNILITNKNLMITIKYSERIEQIKQVLQLQKQGTFEPVESDPFEQFVPATLIDDQTVAYLPQQTRQIEQEENIKDII